MPMIDPPSPFAPESEMRDFLTRWQDDPDPRVKEAVAEVRGNLAMWEKRDAAAAASKKKA